MSPGWVMARLVRVADNRVIAIRCMPAGCSWSGWSFTPEDYPEPGEVRTDWLTEPDGEWQEGQPWP